MTKPCNKCGKDIDFKKNEAGFWKPINPDGTSHLHPKPPEDRSSYGGIVEIAEVWGSDRIAKVNECLKSGWSIIKTVTLRVNYPADHDEPMYILGRRA